MVDLLYLVGHVETALGLSLAFGIGLLDETGVHLGEFVILTTDGYRQVILCGFDALHYPEVIAGVDCLCLCRSTKQSCRLFVPLFFGLVGEEEVLAVGLAFAGKSILHILICLGHHSPPCSI